MKGHVFVLFCGCGLSVSLLAAAEFGIARQPAALAVKSGSVAIFDVGVTGAVAVSYAWYKDGSPVSDNERLSGAQAARLSISPVVVGDAGLYRVQVTDGTNTVFSGEAQLFVDVALPVFTNSPAEQLLSSGSTAVFTAGATGALGIVYCWVREGEPVATNARVSGADSQQLTISAVSNEDTGWYWLTASNAVGVVSSEPARLRVQTASALAIAAGFDEGVWETGGDASWAPQTLVTVDGNALSHGTIGDNQMTYVQVVVFGPSDLEFYWKVSSEASDALVFSIDGADMAWISGEVDWNQRVYHLSSGRHVLRWRYRKDGSVSEGADRGYLDRVSFVPTPQVSLGTALSDTPMSVGTSGHAYWFGQTLTSHDGVSAARSGYISHSQYSLLESVVSGPGYFAFHWKVSSEPGWDRLVFTIDGIEMAAFPGRWIGNCVSLRSRGGYTGLAGNIRRTQVAVPAMIRLGLTRSDSLRWTCATWPRLLIGQSLLGRAAATDLGSARTKSHPMLPTRRRAVRSRTTRLPGYTQR